MLVEYDYAEVEAGEHDLTLLHGLLYEKLEHMKRLSGGTQNTSFMRKLRILIGLALFALSVLFFVVAGSKLDRLVKIKKKFFSFHFGNQKVLILK